VGLQEDLEIGKRAEEFLQYVEMNPYFYSLLERMKLEMAQRILGLTPNDKDAFTIEKTRMEAMDEVMNAVRGDIYIASEALKKMDGKEEKGGIL
jgi:hypothetical protein